MVKKCHLYAIYRQYRVHSTLRCCKIYCKLVFAWFLENGNGRWKKKKAREKEREWKTKSLCFFLKNKIWLEIGCECKQRDFQDLCLHAGSGAALKCFSCGDKWQPLLILKGLQPIMMYISQALFIYLFIRLRIHIYAKSYSMCIYYIVFDDISRACALHGCTVHPCAEICLKSSNESLKYLRFTWNWLLNCSQSAYI